MFFNHGDMAFVIQEKDKQFMQLQQVIDAKQKALIDKQKHLKAISKQNRFLAAVKDDYTKYLTYVNQQKMDQLHALQVLDEYIKELTESGELTKHNLRDAREEQKKIVREVNGIKQSLDDLVDNTTELDKTLNNDDDTNQNQNQHHYPPPLPNV